jgi:hypothetical protein
MGMENPGRKENIKSVTKDEYENAVGYAEVQEEANRENKDFDEAKSWTTKEGVLEHFKFQPHLLNMASPEMRADKEVVLASVSRYGEALKFAAPELQNDREVVEAAVTQNGIALEFASPELRTDREVVMKALDNYAPEAIKFASPQLQEDPEIKKFVRRWRPAMYR